MSAATSNRFQDRTSWIVVAKCLAGICIAASATTLSLPSELAPPRVLRGCDRPVHRTPNLESGLAGLADGTYIPISSVLDPTLRDRVDQLLAAWVHGDSSAMIRLHAPLSDHLMSEVRRDWDAQIKKYRILAYSILAVQPDLGNPFHYRVLSSVTVHLPTGCLEDASLSEWVKLDGKWVTLPSGPRVVF